MVTTDLNIASLQDRALAFLIDLLSIFPISLGIYYFADGTLHEMVGFWEWTLLFYLIASISFTLQSKGKTLGGIIRKIKVTQIESYNYPHAIKIIIRELICVTFLFLLNQTEINFYLVISAVIFLIPLFINPFKINKQFIWDYILKVVVVVDKKN